VDQIKWCQNKEFTVISYRIVNICDRTVMKENIEVGNHYDTYREKNYDISGEFDV
jgi:hypothetical protein